MLILLIKPKLTNELHLLSKHIISAGIGMINCIAVNAGNTILSYSTALASIITYVKTGKLKYMKTKPIQILSKDRGVS